MAATGQRDDRENDGKSDGAEESGLKLRGNDIKSSQETTGGESQRRTIELVTGSLRAARGRASCRNETPDQRPAS